MVVAQVLPRSIVKEGRPVMRGLSACHFSTSYVICLLKTACGPVVDIGRVPGHAIEGSDTTGGLGSSEETRPRPTETAWVLQQFQGMMLDGAVLRSAGRNSTTGCAVVVARTRSGDGRCFVYGAKVDHNAKHRAR
jgi:hypothetical protein